MKVRIKLIEGASWTVESGSGHAIVVDGSPAIGGRDLGMRPMELCLGALGSCSAMDVISILRKGRQDVTDCVIEIEGERADAIPAVFTRIHLRYVVTGRRLDPKKVERAVGLSAEKYCSVSRMLESTVTIDHSFEVVEDGATAG